MPDAPGHSRLKWSIAIVGASLALGAFAWHGLLHTKQGSINRSSLQPPRYPAQGAPLAPSANPAGTQSAGPATPKQSDNYRTSFYASTDYWQFAHALLPAAQGGDANAQYWLSKAIEKCDEDNRMFFIRRGQILSLDEGLQYAVKRHLSMEVAQSVFDRCHGFLVGDSAELGSAPDWLAKATDAGQPLAQAATASKILIRNMMEDSRRSGATPDPGPAVKVGKIADPRELLSAAAKSREPEVLLVIGDLQGLLSPSSTDTHTSEFAWWLVACQRGFDCSGSADWVKNACAGDPRCASASGPTDFVRILAGEKWPEVQQRAQEISADLDAGRWDELGLGS